MTDGGGSNDGGGGDRGAGTGIRLALSNSL